MKIKSNAKWLYDENIQVGRDYQDISNVQSYDVEMAKFRDVTKEATDIIEAISLGREHSLLEIGTGTGNFAIEAAKHCNNVYAIDVSFPIEEYDQKIDSWIETMK